MKDHRMFRLFLLIIIVFAPTIAQRCDLFPKVPLGLTDKNNGIPNAQITASSRLNSQTKAIYGRLHYSDGFLFFRNRDGAGAWVAGNQDTSQWLQVDLGSRHVITGLATQGRKGGREWVMDFFVQYVDDKEPNNWLYYRDEYGSPYLFNGNIDDLGVVENIFLYPIVARYIRVNPQRWNNLISMRMELYGCKLESYIASFAGSSRLEVSLDDGSQTINDKIQFRFRTQNSTGLILYASSDQTDYLAIELYRSKLRVAINLGDTASASGLNEVFAGSMLDDNMWHDVVIVREQRMLNISVDRVKVWLELQSEYLHLNLNEKIFIGGADVFTNKDGLVVRNNFTGCLENVWINGLNVIRDSRTRATTENGISGFTTHGSVGSDCSLTSSNTDEVITLTSTDAYVKATHTSSSSLQASLDFRTFQKGTVLIYHPLLTSDGVSRQFVSIDIDSNGRLQLTVQLDSKTESDLSFVMSNQDQHATGDHFADGLWHSINMRLYENDFLVTVDGYTFKSVRKLQLNYKTDTYIGWAPDRLTLNTERKVYGFRGCIRNMMVQSKQLKYKDLDSEATHGTIKNGTCSMRDRCMPNPCKRNGNCTQDWSQFYCSCPEGYTDSAVCHQSSMFTSCSEVKLLYPTVAEKNVSIDLDGSQILDPIKVSCDFRLPDVRTMVYHTAPNEVVVNGYNAPGSFIYNVDYQTSTVSLAELVRRSVSCRQSIEYKCRNARLLSMPSIGGTTLLNRAWSWWVSRRGQPKFYWGGSVPGHQRCDCGLKGTCQGATVCNCDSFTETGTDDNYLTDNGYLNYKEDLPVTQLRFGDTGTTSDTKDGRFTLGELECTGDTLFDNTVTFRKTDATIEMEPIYSETELDIRFLFKTTQEDAVFFQNTGNQSGHFIEARLKRGREIQFSFNAGYGVRAISTQADVGIGENVIPTIYNDNNWHIVRFERNRKLYSIKIDENTLLSDREPEDQAFQFLKFDSNLFIGATQNFNEGYLGCLSNFMVNGVVQDIRGAIESGSVSYGVSAGCNPRCDSNPCMHSGECTEFYSHYYCECGMTPYRGYICGREVGATFKSSSDRITIDISEREGAKGIQPVDEFMQIGFKTRSKQGILMQVQGQPNSQSNECIIVRLNNAGGITVDLDVGFTWFEITTGDLGIDLANDQHHTVIVYRTGGGKKVHIKVDDYPVQTRDFSDIVGQNQDTRIDKPQKIYIGRNTTLKTGFEGCIFRVQFNNMFPLKMAFQDPPNSRANITSGIKEDYCGYEETMPIADPVEIRPYATIPPNITFESESDIEQRNQTIIALSSLAGVSLMLLLCLICFFRNYTFERGDYETNEAKAGDLTDNPDVALMQDEGGLPSVRGKEWWL